MGYRGKVQEQQQARAMRAGGATLRTIAEALDVSIGSVSGWVRDVPVPDRPRSPARRRQPNALQRRKQREIADAAAWGRAQIQEVTDRDLLVAGAALYAGEGAKRDGMVRFTNTDTRQVAFFCRWLRTIVDVDERRLRASVYLHRELSLQDAERHWSAVTGIPRDQFTKPTRTSRTAGRKTSKHPSGCASVTYCCSLTHRRVMGLVNALLDGSEGGT